MKRTMLPALTALALCGCGAQAGDYPSLAPRPIERLPLGEPATPEAQPPVADPALAARAAGIVADGRAADRAFATILNRERPAIVAGARAPAGGEAWIRGQEALSRVLAARTPLADLVQSLDSLRNERAAAPDPAVDAAWRALSALDAAQARTVAGLSGGAG